MANQTHRLLVDGELHRPERSGAGNPNVLELLNVEDGQYFQDTTTGSVYRYNGDSESWELLVGYDRDNQRITNIGAQTVDGKIGELNVAVGVAPPEAETEGAFEVTGQQSVTVTQLSANLFVPVAEGDELKLVSVQDESVERYVTVVQGAESGGEAVIDIQDDLFRQYFPIGSHIILDGAQFEAKFSVDPSRITLKVNEERELSEFGTLVPPNGTATTIGENLDVGFEGPELEIASTNVSADNPVRVVAGEKIQVYEPFIDGETRVQEFTVAQEGGGVFTSSPFVIPVEETSFTQVFTTRALVREPAFSSSSRISVLSDEVVLKVDSNGNIAAITLSGNADNGSQITIVADDVDINNINFNKENGTIGSNNYVEDVSGWQIEGNGDAEFNSVKIRNGIIVGSVDAGSYVPGNTGIKIVDTLPATGEEGDVVFLTTENKLYRWTGSEWTAAVPTVDLVGQITETQITDDSISTPKLQANSINADKIQSNAVTANKILAGSITTDKILAGAITAAKIDVSELSAITANLGTITAGSISAGIITSGTIDTARLNVSDIITTGSIVVGGDGVSRLTNDAGYTDFDAGDVQAAIDNNVTVISGSKITTGTINASQVNVTNLNADNITTGTLNANRIDVSGIISAGSIIVGGDNISNLTNDAGFTDFDAGDVQGAIDNNVTSISGSKITTGTIDADRIDVNGLFSKTLTVQSGGLIQSEGYNGSNGFQINSNGNASFQEVTITNSSGDFNFSPSNGFVVENSAGGAGITDPKSIGFSAGSLGASIYYSFLSPVNGLFLDSDGDIVLDADASVDVTGSMVVSGNITGKASCFITEAGGSRGIQMGVGSDGDFFMNPTVTSPNFSKEFRYDRTEDRWRSKVDLRTDQDLIYVGSLIDASDQSIKENIESVGSCLDILSQIDAKEYDLIGASTVREFGFLAQDVEPFFPNLVKDIDYTHDDGTTETVKSLSYIQFIPLLVRAIQELKQQLDERSNTA